MRRNLNNHKALIARHQDAHNRAQEEGKTAEGRLPELKQNLSQADKEAQEAHKEAQHRFRWVCSRILKPSVPLTLPAVKEMQHHADADLLS